MNSLNKQFKWIYTCITCIIGLHCCFGKFYLKYQHLHIPRSWFGTVWISLDVMYLINPLLSCLWVGEWSDFTISLLTCIQCRCCTGKSSTDRLTTTVYIKFGHGFISTPTDLTFIVLHLTGPYQNFNIDRWVRKCT